MTRAAARTTEDTFILFGVPDYARPAWANQFKIAVIGTHLACMFGVGGDEPSSRRKECAMAQTLVRFETPVRAESGTLYNATACGRELDSRGWEGWIEFENERTGEVLRSTRETTQPNLTAITYWATGLTNVYLDGALNRILHHPVHKEPQPAAQPFFDGPADRPITPAGQPRGAILNPFSVYKKSPDLLAQELTALRGWHLRQIIKDYDLVEHPDQRLEALTEAELASLIVRGVRDASGHPPE